VRDGLAGIDGVEVKMVLIAGVIGCIVGLKMVG
jgi:hypothetical protein